MAFAPGGERSRVWAGDVCCRAVLWGVIVNIRQLQYFYLAACCGSFSEAARAENVSVQAVSKAMLDLEEEVGAPLFVRGGRTVKLTPLGKSLVGPAREAVASFDAFGRAVELRTQAEAGKKQVDVRLALVSPPFAKHELVCNAFSQLISHMAGIKTQLELAMGVQALADLRAGNIDAMITIGAFSDPRCSCLVLGTVSVGAFMGKNHPLRRKRLLTFADLERYPVLYNEEIDSFNETILSLCRKRGLTSPLISVDTDVGVAEFLEQRDGYVLGVHLKALDIKPLAIMHRVDPSDAPPVPICMVTLKGRQSEAIDRLNRFVRNEFPFMKRVLSST